MTSRQKHSHLLIAGLLRRNSDGTLVNGCVYVGIAGGEPNKAQGIVRNGGYLFERL
jgi:hypothetical protein